MKCYPMLVVQDVAASSAWYQELLGLESGHGGDEFEMLMNEKDVALLLHHVDADEHPALTDPREHGAGGGVLLYFSVDDFDDVVERARAMGANMLNEPHENPKARSREVSLRDLDGYALTVSKWLG